MYRWNLSILFNLKKYYVVLYALMLQFFFYKTSTTFVQIVHASFNLKIKKLSKLHTRQKLTFCKNPLKYLQLVLKDF